MISNHTTPGTPAPNPAMPNPTAPNPTAPNPAAPNPTALTNPPPRARSLVRQTLSIVLLAQMLSAAVLSLAALAYERHTRYHALDERLQGRSDSVLGAVQDAEDPGDNVNIDPTELKLPAEDVYAVYGGDGRLLGHSAFAPPQITQPGANGFRNLGFGNNRYRILQRQAMRVIDRAEFGGVGLRRPVTILYAAPQNGIWHEIFEAARFYLVAIAVAAAVTTLIAAAFLRRALRPIRTLAQAAGGVVAPALVFQTPASVLRVTELRPLADALHKAISGLREAFLREQRFVGDAAHELKTAVAVVRSSVQVLMLRRRSIQEYEAGLERVLEDNARVEALVAQMLQLSSAEQTALAWQQDPASVDLSRQARLVTGQLTSIAQARGVPLHLHAAAQSTVRLSEQRASTLISNLVLNALQHSQAGSPVELSVEQDGSTVLLRVTDSGIGIGPDALPHVFERFFREDPSRSRETGGTGLGLSICKSIADSAGATIGISSQQGKGTTVSVLFMQP